MFADPLIPMKNEMQGKLTGFPYACELLLGDQQGDGHFTLHVPENIGHAGDSLNVSEKQHSRSATRAQQLLLQRVGNLRRNFNPRGSKSKGKHESETPLIP